MLLPGLDGTGTLLSEFAARLSDDAETTIHGYPPEDPLGYDALFESLATRVAARGPTFVLAESFSGPLGVRLATDPRTRDLVRGLILVATFARSPVTAHVARLPLDALFALPPPPLLIRALMVGWDAPRSLVTSVAAATRVPHRAVLAARVRELTRVDVAGELRRASLPVVCIRPTRDRLVRDPLDAPAAACFELHEVTGPHLILQRHPGRCAAIVSTFLARA